MPGERLGDFRDVSGWSAVVSGEARLVTSQDEGEGGKALRLDFDFAGGAGFVVARKGFARALPSSWALELRELGALEIAIAAGPA